jgi:uncharacterized protein YggT (Ycf19 family)
MTHDHRDDPAHPDPDPYRGDETRPVERQTYDERERERERPPEHYDPPPAEHAHRDDRAAGSQVNVNAGGGGYVEASPGPLFYVRRVVSLLFGILAVLLALRIIFLLLVANQTNVIVDAVYNITEPFVAPFRGIFNFDEVSPGGASVFDIAALVALVGWLLIYLLIMAILRIGDRRA